ncbi:ABC transporter ATP-binding protein [Bifidobacterium pseudolongum subsp. pseudolongum]|uniref:ABC transporter ATP-binding protein n=1 Tax=Bifidobacterium pseudolongum TaxID=1694 RepID=UPI000CB1719E|nr:ABC transporter ATP-binding protein [Bifidobacterium pseudolongum]PKV08647.1 ABC transporter ATP-binding protein [Bifidobacterium pseudolongum subsp. pseudolongum]
MDSTALCEVRDCTFAYSGEGAALRNVTLHVRAGELVMLVGPSGCGKTTVTRLVNGLAPSHFTGALTGRACTGGLEAGRAPLESYARVVGSVFQNPKTQYFHARSTDELAFPCENVGMPAPRIRERVRQVAARFGIDDLLDRAIVNLSGGQQQRLAVASAAVLEPAVMVLDEPTSNLDAASMARLHGMIAALKADGVAIVIAEHRLAWCADLVDRYCVFGGGELLGTYTAREFEALPATQREAWGLRALDVSADRARIAALSHLECPAGGAPVLGTRGLEVGYRTRGMLRRGRGAAFSRRIPDVDVYGGQIVGIMGHNGAGKSTFARTLCGLQAPLAGTIELGGEPASASALSRAAALVMQDVHYQLFAESVRAEVMLETVQHGGSEQELAAAREQCDALLAELDLLDVADRHPMSLSGGQKQRLAIAVALMGRKRFVVLDEPTSGLDRAHMMQVGALLRELADRGVAVLVITHDDELAAHWCDRILALD